MREPSAITLVHLADELILEYNHFSLPFTDFLIYNGKLVEELRESNFNFGCIESIGLDGLQLGILHMLGIENTCVTTSVAPTVPHWEFMGFKSIVKNIPGLNLAKIGDHEMIENQDQHRLEEITANNQMWLERKGKVGEKTVSYLRNFINV
jgi:hypothetical protein